MNDLNSVYIIGTVDGAISSGELGISFNIKNSRLEFNPETKEFETIEILIPVVFPKGFVGMSGDSKKIKAGARLGINGRLTKGLGLYIEGYEFQNLK